TADNFMNNIFRSNPPGCPNGSIANPLAGTPWPTNTGPLVTSFAASSYGPVNGVLGASYGQPNSNLPLTSVASGSRHSILHSTSLVANVTLPASCTAGPTLVQNVNNGMPIAQITDGTSNTILLPERAGKPSWYWQGTKVDTSKTLAYPLNAANGNLNSHDPTVDEGGGGWGDPGDAFGWLLPAWVPAGPPPPVAGSAFPDTAAR